jgi:hypothetical protein
MRVDANQVAFGCVHPGFTSAVESSTIICDLHLASRILPSKYLWLPWPSALSSLWRR